jgi:choline-sulfatase
MRNRKSLILRTLIFGILSLCLSYTACRKEKAKHTPSLLLVTIDTLRADRLGVYGWDKARTPNLDALAASGRYYKEVFTPVPITLPAHASILTGRLPFQHGIRNNSFYILSQDENTLAETLKSAGYQTAAIIGAAVLDHRFGLDQGFDLYDDDVGKGDAGLFIAERSASEVTKRALSWLADLDRESPFFLWVHYFDPHDPYRPPARHSLRIQQPTYDDEIAYVDEQIGELIEGLKNRGMWVNTLTAVTSDHGEGLGEHGEETHGIFLYDSTLRVPLILAGPGIYSGNSDQDFLLGLTDLFPTLLGHLGLSGSESIEGLDFLDSEPTRDSLYAETFLPNDFYNWSKLVALRSKRWKYVKAPLPELYDLAADPAEVHSIVEMEKSQVSSMARVLDEMYVEEGSYKATEEVPADLLNRIASLGYVGSVTGSREAIEKRGESLPDPKKMVHLVAKMDDALASIRERQLDAGIIKLRRILQEDPTNFLATHSLADALYDAGRSREAIQSYQRTLELGRETAYYHYRLALLHEKLNLHQKAADHLSRVIQRNSAAAQETLERGDSLLDKGLAKEALAYYEAVEKGGVQANRVELSIVTALLEMRQPEKAQRRLEDAIQKYPDNEQLRSLWTTTLNLLGQKRGNQGNLKDAIRFFKKATLSNSSDFESWANLALTYLRAGRSHDSMNPLARAIELNPTAVRLINLLGELHFQKGDYARAKNLLEMSLKLDAGQEKIDRALQEIEKQLTER